MTLFSVLAVSVRLRMERHLTVEGLVLMSHTQKQTAKKTVYKYIIFVSVYYFFCHMHTTSRSKSNSEVIVMKYFSNSQLFLLCSCLFEIHKRKYDYAEY